MQKIQKLFIASVIVSGYFVHAKHPERVEVTTRQLAQDFAVGCAIGGATRAVANAVYKPVWVVDQNDSSGVRRGPPAGQEWAHAVGLESARDLHILSEFAFVEVARPKYEKMVGRASYLTLFGCIIGDALANNIEVDRNNNVRVKGKISISCWMLELLRHWVRN